MKKIFLLFLASFFIFVFNCHSQQDSYSKNFRHQDDKEFNLEKLKGHYKKDKNAAYREEFYSRINFELTEKQRKFPSGDTSKDIGEQFENMIDFSDEKRSEILKYHKEFQDRLSSYHDSPEINDISGDEQADFIGIEAEEFLWNVSTVLTNDEFEKLFLFPVDNIPGSFTRLLLISGTE